MWQTTRLLVLRATNHALRDRLARGWEDMDRLGISVSWFGNSKSQVFKHVVVSNAVDLLTNDRISYTCVISAESIEQGVVRDIAVTTINFNGNLIVSKPVLGKKKGATLGLHWSVPLF